MDPDPAALASHCDEALRWPVPGGGRTAERWRLLLDLARADLVLGRLVEAHADAVAILAELGGPPATAGQRWGVWAAGPPDAATLVEGRLHGERPWCSGATLLTHALVTADAGGGTQLCAVDLAAAGVQPQPSAWVGPGMAGADTRTVRFDGVAVVPVGPLDGYLQRPGFWLGAVGVAACWLGGADRVAEVLRTKGATSTEPHLLAHLGAVHVALAQARALLEAAAVHADARPSADHAVLARTVRAAVDAAAQEVMARVGRATGPAPLAHDAAHAAVVADLAVYVRQHHAERDLEQLGRDVIREEPGR